MRLRPPQRVPVSTIPVSTLICACVVALLLAGSAATGQISDPRLNSRPGMRAQAPNPAEYNAYVAAMTRTPPSAKAEALRAFIQQYPQSSLGPEARRWLMSNSNARLAPTPQALVRPVPAPPAPPAASLAAPVNPSPPAPRPTQEAARAAIVKLDLHSLTIRADNSSLSQILRDLSTSSGMHVEGLATDQRIYGSFGPGEPLTVLASLVDGLGYNIMMVGESAAGVPRQLILSPRSDVAAAPEAAQQASSEPDQAEEDMSSDDPANAPEIVSPPRNFPVGAQPNDPAAGGRTTQQMLEEMRRMRQPGQPDPANQPPQ